MKEVERKTLAERISDALTESILDGSLPMGEKLGTQDLANRFGVSRMPVREALITLVNSGLVEAMPYAGYRVSGLRADRIQQIYVIRGALEPLLAEKACSLISDEQIDTLSESLHKMTQATQGSAASARKVYLSNREFHFHLYDASGWDEVVDNVRIAWNKIAVYKLLYSRKYVKDNEAGRAMLDEHRRIIELVGDRDGKGAAEAIGKAIREHQVAVPREFSAS